MSDARLDLLDRLMERYNAGDADGYAAFFAEDGCEAMYRGDVLRAGREGVRAGNAKTFADFPYLTDSATMMLDHLVWWTNSLKASRELLPAEPFDPAKALRSVGIKA